MKKSWRENNIQGNWPMRKFLLSLIVISLLAVGALRGSFVRAQQPGPAATPKPTPAAVATPSPTPQKPAGGEDDVVRISTNLVQVDAVVTDKNGKVVTDLRPEEIRIFEDGRAQDITNFSYVIADSSSPGQPRPAPVADKTVPPPPTAPLRPDQVRRTIALVVDDLGLSFESTSSVRRSLKKFVDEQMEPGDLVAIIRTSGGIGALQQFTSDKRQLYAAIERVKWYSSGRGGVSAFAPIADNSSANADAQASQEDLDQFREDVFSVGTLGAVRYVVKGLRELPGRKSVLLISDGFKITSRDQQQTLRAFEELRRLVDEAGRASVVIYTINATGLQTLGLTAADSTGRMNPVQIQQQLMNRRAAAFDSQEGLNYLAQETGGLAIHNNNDLSGGIRRVIDDQRGYYLIGYRPDESTFDSKTGRRTFHKLSVKVLRPGKFNVRMRNGFIGISDEEMRAAQPTARDQILGALFSPFGAAGVHVRLTPLFANDAKGGAFLRSMLHVNASDLTFTNEPDGWHQAEFDVVAVTFGDNGRIVDQISRTHVMRARGERYQQVLRDGFVYFFTFPIKNPGAYQLRAALRDHGSEHIGSASQFIEIPDVKKNRLVLSSLVLTGINPASLKKPEAAPDAGNPATANAHEGEENVDPMNSSAVRQMHRGTIVRYGLIAYNAHLDKAGGPPQLQIQVRMFREGKIVFSGKQQPLDPVNQPDLKRLDVDGAFQLGTEMEPGEYVLQVVVTDLLADQKHRVATQWSDFEIVK
jgi:VWFA-related protein